VTLLQNQVLIFGEDLAKHGVSSWIDTLIRFREMRRTLLIFTCQGKAADILKVQPKIEPNPAEYFRDLVLLSKKSGLFPLTNLHSFMRRYESYAQQNYTPLLAPNPKPKSDQAGSSGEAGGGGEQGGKKPPTEMRIIGTAVFNKDKMVGKLDLYDSQILQLLTNQFKEAFLSIPDPQAKGKLIVYRLSPAKPVEIKYTQKEVAYFDVQLLLEANIVSIQSEVNYSKPEKERLLAKKISRELERRVRRVITKSQKQFKSDIFGFGANVRNTLLTSTEWDKYGWPRKYPSSQISVKVITHIRRVGVQFQPPQERD
jgi:spore germination protein KC